MMDLVILAVSFGFSFVSLLLVLRGLRRLHSVSGEAVVVPLIRQLEFMGGLREQEHRATIEAIKQTSREQAVRSQSILDDSATTLKEFRDRISSTVDAISKASEQRLQIVEDSTDSFISELARKTDVLTQSAGASASLQDELRITLTELKVSVDAMKQYYALNGQQTEVLSGTIRILQSGPSTIAQQLREETVTQFKSLMDSMLMALTGASQLQKAELAEIRNTVQAGLATLQEENGEKLDRIRQTVDETLQGTLESRLGKSFKQVTDRLEEVSNGLGEMKTLATGVDDLKRVLRSVKAEGMWGEVQLGRIIEDFLTPDQFGRYVATSREGEHVDYAVKLPSRQSSGRPVWLPIDAKFPMENYQVLVRASERGDAESVGTASRQLEEEVRERAKEIADKYLAPPKTTDFGILFLCTEGLYAEVLRRPGLVASIQRDYRVVLAGPSTVAAVLNALQMGFRTFAIEKRSTQVWETLGLVKAEFGKYAGILTKVKMKLSEAQDSINNAETQTQAIQYRLRVAPEGPGILDSAEEAFIDTARLEQITV